MSSPLRILLIDDNPVDRARIIEELSRGFADLQVQQVSNEREYAGAMEAGVFDLVLCDYLLPWTDGLAIARAIKARWPEMPVLMVTGSGNEEIAIAAIKAGLDDYILKSHRHLARLSTAVRSALERVEQQRRLEDVEARYQAVFDRVPVGLYRATQAGEFLDVNPALVDMLRYPSRGSLKAARAADLYLHLDDWVEWQRRAEQDGVVREYEIPFRRRDGSIAWLRNNARVVRDTAGRVLWYEGSLEDITERKRAEGALAERMRQLETMRTATVEIVRELDLATVLDVVTRRAVGLVGGTSGGVSLWDDAAEVLAPSAWWGHEELFRAVRWRLGEGVIGSVAERRQGMAVNEYQASAYAQPLFMEGARIAAMVAEPLVRGDRLLGVIAVASEDADRRFTESDRQMLSLFATQAAVVMENARLFGQVSQAKREWENTFDAAADLIAVIDVEYRILRVNRALARRLGVEPGALIGRPGDDAFEGAGSRSSRSAFSRCLESRAAVTEEWEAPGTGEVFLQTHSPFLDARGRLVGVVQISKDVTAQRQLQQQLAQSEKMAAMGRMVSGVAHELNNPLTAIFGNAQLLKLRAVDEITRQRAEILMGEAERTAKIVRNLLTFARSQSPERRSVRVERVLDDALEARAQEFALHQIAVVRNGAGPLPPVMADPDQIRQVFLNLLSNAEQAVAGRPERRIEVSAVVDAAQGWVTVGVADTGPGIPADALGKIFDPFFTTREVGKGTGLGLAICYAIVQEHGGRLRAGNRPQGGAWLEVDLPVRAGVEDPPNVPPAVAGGPAGGKRILVADDEEAIVRLVSDALRMEGHQVEVAKDGRVAVEKLTAGEFDLVFMDMKMPGFSGDQIYDDVIRGKAAPPRVIIMTGDTVNTDTCRFLERTGLRCVSKPFTLEEIWDCVRETNHSGPHPHMPAPSVIPAS
jgi:two-component system, NtrC family, sensor kinase